ncbi:uncharacterized protein LOC113161765 [Anabas testudineus]|uniref:uncharacterized protein LOC113161765 n=1 Tax=Anabas testudineus TaxID=64144 RepID=UPI000E464B53|nr:uncharacterized protein LOC113161765 [Anabas testudineus]
MKILVGFLLAVLGCSLTEGRLVPECELWGELKNATVNQNLTGNNLVAKLVCQAGLASGLNTSVVTQPIAKEVSHSTEEADDHPGKEDNHGRDKGRHHNSRVSNHRVRRNDKQRSLQTRANCTSGVSQEGLTSGLNTSAENHQEEGKEDNHGRDKGRHYNSRVSNHRVQRNDKQRSLQTRGNCTSGVCNEGLTSSLNTSAENHQEDHRKKDNHNDGRSGRPRGRRNDRKPSWPTQSDPKNCVLYGIFQLSSCQACNDGITPTANVCGISCSNLLDDDISDDISCLLKILGDLSDDHAGSKRREEEGLLRTISDKCEHEQDSVYIAKC